MKVEIWHSALRQSTETVTMYLDSQSQDSNWVSRDIIKKIGAEHAVSPLEKRISFVNINGETQLIASEAIDLHFRRISSQKIIDHKPYRATFYVKDADFGGLGLVLGNRDCYRFRFLRQWRGRVVAVNYHRKQTLGMIFPNSAPTGLLIDSWPLDQKEDQEIENARHADAVEQQEKTRKKRQRKMEAKEKREEREKRKEEQAGKEPTK
jgi:hypothetical protein